MKDFDRFNAAGKRALLVYALTDTAVNDRISVKSLIYTQLLTDLTADNLLRLGDYPAALRLTYKYVTSPEDRAAISTLDCFLSTNVEFCKEAMGRGPWWVDLLMVTMLRHDDNLMHVRPQVARMMKKVGVMWFMRVVGLGKDEAGEIAKYMFKRRQSNSEGNRGLD